jgi:pyruvate kinase
MSQTLAVDDQSADLTDLLGRLQSLRERIMRESSALLGSWGGVDATLPPGVANLAEYVALRRHDLNELQFRLAAYGLSSLGRSEAKVSVALDTIITTLRRLCGDREAAYPSDSAMRAGEKALNAARDQIFGAAHDGARAYIMATFPSEAAEDAALVEQLIDAGMDCARINCAHDDADAWARMIANVRAAEARLGRRCRIFMDIAGPKCRVAAVRAPDKLRLHKGDQFTFATRLKKSDSGVAITATFPQIVGQLKIGAEVWINDGKIGTRVVDISPSGATLEVFSARQKGERLKPEKGMNFPTTPLNLSPLTDKDFVDLDFVAVHADIVGFSFVQNPSDIELLQDHLAARRGARPQQPLVLKIETPLAVQNLPRLILQSALHNPTGVMIARGDLAVELGFARLAEMQEELLWLCEAAHVPVIWATQVLDQFVHDGVISRAEATDAAMAQRADCVMLNKGPCLAEGVTLLRDILTRMDRHHVKKFPRLTALHAW